MINLSRDPETEEERQALVELMTKLDLAQIRSRCMHGGACLKCGEGTIIIDLAPTTRECQSCGETEEI